MIETNIPWWAWLVQFPAIPIALGLCVFAIIAGITWLAKSQQHRKQLASAPPPGLPIKLSCILPIAILIAGGAVYLAMTLWIVEEVSVIEWALQSSDPTVPNGRVAIVSSRSPVSCDASASFNVHLSLPVDPASPRAREAIGGSVSRMIEMSADHPEAWADRLQSTLREIQPDATSEQIAAQVELWRTWLAFLKTSPTVQQARAFPQGGSLKALPQTQMGFVRSLRSRWWVTGLAALASTAVTAWIVSLHHARRITTA